ncbi:MAG TPA: c-type cytochrome [Burkholderiaceae bacterium]|nr:c-type cytochrome [Burkholderiaceae bacterium]
MAWRHAAVGLLGAALLFLLGWDVMAPGEAAPPRQTGDVHELGRRVYNFRCYYCHGYSGDAKTLATSFLVPPPRDFTAAGTLGEAQIAEAVRHGRAGTAMASFRGVIPESEIDAVAAFVAREFVRERKPNTAYHTPANGWPGHERHAAAFPFARGEIPIDADDASLDATQRAGRHLFMNTCISCHDRARVADAGPAWAARPLSYPRLGFAPGDALVPVDAVSSASVYAKHEVAPAIANLTAVEREGQVLFQANCAFCHGADGTGKNWIGQFMEPKARDLTQYSARTMPPELLRERILAGLPGTSMPAWQHVLDGAQIDALAAYIGRAMFRREPGARE